MVESNHKRQRAIQAACPESRFTEGESMPIIDVRFDAPYRQIDGSSGGAWSLTWADDDALYAGSLEGTNLGGIPPALISLGKLQGEEPDRLLGHTVNAMPDYADGGGTWGERWRPDGAGWRMTSPYSVNGTLYAFVMRRLHPETAPNGDHRIAFANSSLVASTDHGKTWRRSCDENYEHPMFSGQRFGAPFFVLYGKDGAAPSKDNAHKYVYAVSNNGFFAHGDDYVIGRAERSRLREFKATDWSFYQGGDGMHDGSWGKALDSATAILSNPLRAGMTGVTYVPGLQRYVLVSWHYHHAWWNPGATIDFGTTLEFHEAPQPWGPWTKVKAFTATQLGWWVPIIGQRFQEVEAPGIVKAILYASGNIREPEMKRLNHLPVTLSAEPLQHRDPAYAGER